MSLDASASVICVWVTSEARILEGMNTVQSKGF